MDDFLFVLLFTTTTLSSLLPTSVTANQNDGDIMAKLARTLKPVPSGWSAPDPCHWTGVDCDSSGRVTSIDIGTLSIGSELPPELNQLAGLKTLYLQKNQLSGPFRSLADLKSLEHVYIDGNNFTSAPSDFLKGLTSLQTLSLGENPDLASWTLPNSRADSTTLTSHHADECNLAGPIPDIFGSFPGLQSLRLSYNNLAGSLRVSLAKTGIQTLWLGNQALGLSGTIGVLGSMTQITQFWLDESQFSGSIPDLSKCTSLFDLSLRDNQLTGPNNKLQGPRPSFLNGVQVNMGTSNSFCNPNPDPCDPQEWKSVTSDTNNNVAVLNFEKQSLKGSISPAIANLTQLTKLLLNDNGLNGTIPDGLTTSTKLQILDISNNNISGKVPEFRSDVSLNTSGNPFIGKNLAPDGKMGAGSKSMSSISRGVIVGLIIAGVVFIVVTSLVIYNISVEVLREATNNFCENNVLGRGGFGVVYSGQLPNGTKIAVKRMEGMMLKAETEVLSKVRHRHLVGLYGFCDNEQDVQERLLVYEYMSGGTLAQRLFVYEALGLPPLTFIHRDLKLGDDMRAKVSDFGLVKNAPEDGQHSVETTLAGTFGYLAPEHATTGKVTAKVDVFAFGVILMEVITGRKALDKTLPDNECHLESFEGVCKVAELAGHCTAIEPSELPDMGHAVTVLATLVDWWKPSAGDVEDGGGGIDLDVYHSQAIENTQMVGDTTIIDTSGGP
ncbi:Non-specific serine/threonine protein kinase [Bertholletia excelsa]